MNQTDKNYLAQYQENEEQQTNLTREAQIGDEGGCWSLVYGRIAKTCRILKRTCVY